MHHLRLLRRLLACALLIAITALSPLASRTARASVEQSLASAAPSSTTFATTNTTSTAQLTPLTALVIGEIAWAGSSLSTADEWLELWNLGDAPISLMGWSLRGVSAASPIVFPPTAMLPSHSAFLISNNSSSDTKSALATISRIVTTDVSLSNTQLKVELLDATGAVVDRAGTGGAPLAGASIPTKISMLRINPFADGSIAGAWANATSSLNFKSVANDLGTPGVCDTCGSSTGAQKLMPSTASSTEVIATSSSMLMRHDTSLATTTASSLQKTPLPPTSTSSLAHTTNADSAITTILFSTTTSRFNAATSTMRQATGTTMSAVAGVATTTSVRSASVTTTSTTVIRPAPTNTNPSIQTALAQTPSISKFDETPKPNYNMLRLNEVAPSPLSGQEWIEIATLDASHAINLRGCTVHDRNGRIRTIGDIMLNPATSKYAVITLQKSRLNNMGDSVALYAPDGRLLDAISYGATRKGESWMRFPDMTGEWEKTASSTPHAPNERVALTAVRQTETAQDSALQISPNGHAALITTTTTTKEETGVHVGQFNDRTSVSEQSTLSSQALSLSFHHEQEEKVSAATQRLPTKLTEDVQNKTTLHDAPRIATRKKSIPRTPRAATLIHSITFDMLQQETFDTLRVRLTGRVGSLPGLVARRAFILQNPDGRGLLVTAPSRQRLPRFGNDVSAIGTLQIDEKGAASLRMSTKDTWSQLPTSTAQVRPRLVDLLVPSAEDAWSFITVTGTVKHITSGAVQLDLGDTELTVMIKPLLKYRAKRLVAGDVLMVRGLLDLTRDNPRLLPRLAEDISIVQHAPPQQTVASSALRSQGPMLPPWVPFGAAGGAVAVTAGVKRLHRRRKMRALAQKVENETS